MRNQHYIRLCSLYLMLVLRASARFSGAPWTISRSRRPYCVSSSLGRRFLFRGGETNAIEARSPLPSILEHNNTTAADAHTLYTNTTLQATESATSTVGTGSSTLQSSWKTTLPPPLCNKGPKTLQKLVLGQVDIYLLGTAHVSNDSSADVKLLLNATNPHAILVELCDARIALLEGGPDQQQAANVSRSDIGFWDRLKSVQQEQGGSTMQAMGSVLLTSVQEDYASELGVELGGEFRAAYRYWRGCQMKPHMILGDRPLQLTLIRAWESLWWWPKTKVMAGLLWSSFQKPNKDELIKFLEAVRLEESDILTESLNDLRKHYPSLHTCIIKERDAWLAAKLVQTCRALNIRASRSGERQVVVAIVGAGHVPGIFEWLTNNTSTETPEQILSKLVTTRKFAKDATTNELMASWVNEVTELQDSPDSNWTWAQQQASVESAPSTNVPR